jgi:predicted type IV restriction endonuclease
MNSSRHEDQSIRNQARLLSAEVAKHAGGLNETLTKRVMTEPMLETLGWNLRDPAEVDSERPVARGRVDYSLIIGGRAEVFVEVKALRAGPPLSGEAPQLLKYCATEGVRWGLLTDGSTWELYDCYRQGPMTEKLVFSLTLSQLPDDAD